MAILSFLGTTLENFYTPGLLCATREIIIHKFNKSLRGGIIIHHSGHGHEALNRGRTKCPLLSHISVSQKKTEEAGRLPHNTRS